MATQGRKAPHAVVTDLARAPDAAIPYVARAKREGFRSRAAYKLAEIDDKYRLLKPGARVVDLGAAPGGWSEMAARRVGPNGRVVALDLLDMKPIPGVEFLMLDFLDDGGAGAAQGHARSAEKLTWCSPTWRRTPPATGKPIICASWGWRSGGRLRARSARAGRAFLCKVLQGGTEAAFLAELKRDFTTVKHVKPPASRSDSAELYLLARDFAAART